MKKKTLKYIIIGIIAVLIALFFIIKYAITPSYPDIVNPKPIIGNKDAQVKIIEYSDFQCPACGAAEPVARQIAEEFGDKISFEYRHFPLTSIHQYSFKAAEASECANDQGRFWEYHDILFRNQNSLKVSDLKRYADTLGLDTKSFNACLDSGAKKDIINLETREALAAGSTGTPTFFINGKKLANWKYELFKAAVEEELKIR